MNVALLFVLGLLFLSRFGEIWLGGPDARPEFSTFGWFSMLFSAGMGIGLLFYGVAEPMFHYVANPLTEAGGPEVSAYDGRIIGVVGGRFDPEEAKNPRPRSACPTPSPANTPWLCWKARAWRSSSGSGVTPCGRIQSPAPSRRRRGRFCCRIRSPGY